MSDINQDAKTTIKLRGMAKVLENLALLGKSVGGPIGKKAMNKALTPMLKAARSGIQVETGFSKKSLGKKVLHYSQTGIILGLIGADKAYKTFRQSSPKAKSKIHQPSKILHLLEFGTTKAPGSRFLTTAYNNTVQQVMIIFAKEVKAGIDKLRFKHTK